MERGDGEWDLSSPLCVSIPHVANDGALATREHAGEKAQQVITKNAEGT
jgi:hypothetical protein